MENEFNLIEKKEYLLDPKSNIQEDTIREQNIYLNSSIINENFLVIEDHLNLLYEKTRALEDVISYARDYVNTEIETTITECKNVLKDIENLNFINFNNITNYIAINVPITISPSSQYLDRDGAPLNSCDIYNNKLVLAEKREMNVKISMATVQRKQSPIEMNDDCFLNDKPYRVKYILDGVLKGGAFECINLYFKKKENINTVKIKLANCTIVGIDYIYGKDILIKETNFDTGITPNRTIDGISILIRSTNYEKVVQNINANIKNSFDE